MKRSGVVSGRGEAINARATAGANVVSLRDQIKRIPKGPLTATIREHLERQLGKAVEDYEEAKKKEAEHG